MKNSSIIENKSTELKKQREELKELYINIKEQFYEKAQFNQWSTDLRAIKINKVDKIKYEFFFPVTQIDEKISLSREQEYALYSDANRRFKDFYDSYFPIMNKVDQGLKNIKTQLDLNNKENFISFRHSLDFISTSQLESLQHKKDSFLNTFKKVQNLNTQSLYASSFKKLQELEKVLQEPEEQINEIIKKVNKVPAEIKEAFQTGKDKFDQEIKNQDLEQKNWTALNQLISISEANQENEVQKKTVVLKYQELANLCLKKLFWLLVPWSSAPHSELINQEIKEIEAIKNQIKKENLIDQLIFDFADGIIAGLQNLQNNKALDLDQNSSFIKIVKVLGEDQYKDSPLANDISAICYGYSLGVPKNDASKCEEYENQVKEKFKNEKVFCFPLFLSLKLQFIFMERFHVSDLSKVHLSKIELGAKLFKMYWPKRFTYCFFMQLWNQFLDQKDKPLDKEHIADHLIPLIQLCCFFNKFEFPVFDGLSEISQSLVVPGDKKIINEWFTSHESEFKTILPLITMDQKLEVGKVLACLEHSEIKMPPKKAFIEIWRQNFWKSDTSKNAEEELKIQLKMLELENCHPSLIPKRMSLSELYQIKDEKEEEKEWMELGDNWIMSQFKHINQSIKKNKNSSKELLSQLHIYRPFLKKFGHHGLSKNIGNTLNTIFNDENTSNDFFNDEDISNDFMESRQDKNQNFILWLIKSAILDNQLSIKTPWIKKLYKPKPKYKYENGNFWNQYAFHCNFSKEPSFEFKFKNEKNYINQLDLFLSDQNYFIDQKIEILLSFSKTLGDNAVDKKNNNIIQKLLHDSTIQKVLEKVLEKEQLSFENHLRVLEYVEFIYYNTPYKFFKHHWLNSEKVWDSLNEQLLESNPLLEKLNSEKILLLLRNSLEYIIRKNILKISSIDPEDLST